MAERRVSRWYFGGLASCGAACCTHPLDLLKVHLQTQQEVKMRMMGMAMRVVRTDGFLALYNGLSASLCRQMTYSLTRFAIYETARDRLGQGSQGPPPFYQKVLLGAVGGERGRGTLGPGSLWPEEPRPQLSSGRRFHRRLCGDPGGHGERQDAERRQAAGPPAAKVSGVRALGSGGCGGAAGRQRCTSSGRELWEPAGWGELWESPTLTPSPLTPCSYSHALDGMYRVLREEGLKKLFSGATMASSRGALVTVGQLSCYDQAKQLVLTTGLLSDNIFTHFLASFIAGGCATFLCQPLDVLKTRLMNSQGEYRGVTHCAMETAKLGPLAFYKGFVPAAIRLIPHTVLTFVFLEQLRKYFGIKVVT
uniref:Solute carrier family 25 member 10 n=1 Tax=Anas platyrhynchos TaxID=8839 RepID=A0A8B9R184_ANAPL